MSEREGMVGGARRGPAAAGEVTVVAKEHPYESSALAWRVLDVARSARNYERASWHRPPYAAATGHAFIATWRSPGLDPELSAPALRKRVRVIDRHPLDDWADVSEAVLLAQLARAYLPPPGWVERHGGTGVGWHRDRGAGRVEYGPPSVTSG